MMRIKELRLVGAAVRPAVAIFDGGLNVFTGASNTGKSFILSCLDFVFGSKQMAKTIEEAAPYERALVQIENDHSQILTLLRPLAGGDLLCYPCPIDDIAGTQGVPLIWDRRKSPKRDLSSVLLEFAGIPAAKIRTNVRGETDPLTFRLIKPLFMVSENAIIEEHSPIQDGSGYAETARQNALAYMLTGRDDSSIVAAPDPRLTKAGAHAKIQLIDSLLGPIEQRLRAMPHDDRPPEDRIRALDQSIDDVSTTLTDIEKSSRDMRAARAREITEMQKAESQLLALGEMVRRFDLLNQRYMSDLERLNFMSEASYYFDGLQEAQCALCGQMIKSDHAEHVRTSVDLNEIQSAVRAEAGKILALQQELKRGRVDLERRLDEQKRKVIVHKQLVEDLDTSLQTRVNSRLLEMRDALKTLMAARLLVEGEMSDRAQAATLRQARVDAEAELRPATRQTWSGPSSIALDNLCREIEKVLTEWSWPGRRVTYDEKAMDIVVDGKPRKANGKGVRALLHSAFSIGFLRFTADNKLPHPGFVILDSPLTTYKQGRARDGSEQLGQTVEYAFFSSLAQTPKHLQVIVLENKSVDERIIPMIRYEYFSGVPGEDRTGFIPPAAKPVP